MSDLDIKIKEFLADCKRIRELKSILKGLNYSFPFTNKERQKKIDEGIVKIESEIKTIRENLHKFTKEEFNLISNKFEITSILKICPFCSRDILIYSNEIVCGKCKYLFYEE